MVTESYKSAIHSLWLDRCTVFILENQKDARTGKTKQRKAVLFSAEPCRLSFKSVTVPDETADAARTAQTTILFLDKNLEIPSGSTILVTHEGVTSEYVKSGVPAVYSVHQEIPLELKGAWA